MKKAKIAGRPLGTGKIVLLAVCALILLGAQTSQLSAQVPSTIDWNTTTTYTIKPSSGYDYNFTAFGVYNGTYYNLYCPLNYPGDLPLIVQFGGYAGINHGLANLMEDSPLCGHLASQGYAVLEFGYETGGTIPEASQTCLEVLIGTILPWVENNTFPLTVDKSKIALCGHSAGGSVVLGLASPKIASSVALTPYYLSTSLVPQVQNIAPTLILTGQGDTLVPYHDNGTAYYSSLVAPKAILDITGGDHNLGVGTFDFNTEGTAATLKYVTAWFDATLKGNAAETSFFTSSYLSADAGVNIYQVEMTSSTPAQSRGGIDAREINFNQLIPYGIIIGVSVGIIVGFTIYRPRKHAQNTQATEQ